MIYYVNGLSIANSDLWWGNEGEVTPYIWYDYVIIEILNLRRSFHLKYKINN